MSSYSNPGAINAHMRELDILLNEFDLINLLDGLVLDMGCGHGDLLAKMKQKHPQCTPLGVDIDQQIIINSREKHPGIYFMCSNVESTFILDNSISLVFNSGLYDNQHNFSDFNFNPANYAKEVARVLKSQGTILIMDGGFKRNNISDFEKVGIETLIDNDGVVYFGQKASQEKNMYMSQLTADNYVNLLTEILNDTGYGQVLDGPIVDIGCGDGKFIGALQKKNQLVQCHGLDRDKIAIQKAYKNNSEVEFHQSLLPKLPFPDNSVALSNGMLILEYALSSNFDGSFDIWEYADELFRITKPGGIHVSSEYALENDDYLPFYCVGFKKLDLIDNGNFFQKPEVKK